MRASFEWEENQQWIQSAGGYCVSRGRGIKGT
jgi:hypothetical protein